MGVCCVFSSLIPSTFIQRLLVLEAYVISLELFYCTFSLGDMFVFCHFGLSLIVLFSLCAKKKKRKKNNSINKCARVCIKYQYSLSTYMDL